MFENFSINENNGKPHFWQVLGQRLSNNNGYNARWVADDSLKKDSLEKDVKASKGEQKLAVISGLKAGNVEHYQVTTHKDNVDDVMKIAKSILDTHQSNLPDGYEVRRQGDWFVQVDYSPKKNVEVKKDGEW